MVQKSLCFIFYLCLFLRIDSINNSTEMNSFLEKMLIKSADELDGEKISRDIAKPKVERLAQHESSNWLKNRSTRSLNESDSTITTRSPSRPIKFKIEEYRNQRNSMPGLTTSKSIADSEVVPSIEKIRREFEMGFSSPTKQDTNENSTRSGRFVKKLVAAFEEKYNKTFHDGKTEKKQFSRKLVPSANSSFEDETMLADMMDESMAMLSETYVVESLESRLSRYLNSYIATSTLREQESPSESESSVDLGKSSFTMDEELRSPKQNMSRKKKTTRPNSETILTTPIIEEESMESTGKVVRSNSSLKRERKPKIVGAYLKEPVEVEDTAIDWIPITGKKLPRKTSFKRLLSILTGKKSLMKSSKLYCSELNLQEETSRDLLQDSGYDEKSGSSSSLVSLVSVNDLMSQQRTESSANLKDDRRVNNMTTFQKAPASVVEHDSTSDNDYDNDYPDDDFSSINDDISDTSSVSSNKILLEEVSRSDLRLSLGPAFPSAAGAKVVCSLGRRSNSKHAKNTWSFLDDIEPIAPPLPKHPFVSLKEKSVDNTEEIAQEPATKKLDNQSDLSFSDFDKVELRRYRQSWKFPTEDYHYDTPRRHLSKSEPVLGPALHQPQNVGKLPIDIVYDVPQVQLPTRPRSSIYDDALSLKRRNDHFTSHQPSLAHEFYGFPTTMEPHYATIKPRNTRITADRKFLRSLGGLDNIDPMYSEYYYDRASNGIMV